MATGGAASAAIGNDSGSMFKLLTSAPRPRELTGAVDLITHYGLREHYETYTKKSFPASIAESKYLRDVVGDTEIRKGEGMEVGQLLRPSSIANDPFPVDIRPFDLEHLRRAFTLRESGPISLPEADRGLPTIGKTKDEERKKHKKHKKHKHKDKDKEKDKEKRKEKHKEKDKEHAAGNGEDKKKHKKKKRKHDGDEEEGDGHKHKKKKRDKNSPNPDAVAVKAR